MLLHFKKIIDVIYFFEWEVFFWEAKDFFLGSQGLGPGRAGIFFLGSQGFSPGRAGFISWEARDWVLGSQGYFREN